jgi:hypothetical protein
MKQPRRRDAGIIPINHRYNRKKNSQIYVTPSGLSYTIVLQL